MKSIQLNLVYIYPVLAIIYLVSMQFIPYFGHPYLKALPIVYLAMIVFWNYVRNSMSGKSHLLFGIGFTLSSLGDISLSSNIANSFVIGLGFFLLAHIFYIIAFSLLPKDRFINRIGIIFGVLLYGSVIAYLVLPRTGEMLIPVLIYIIIIVSMGCYAVIQKFSIYSFLLGAIAFLISDGVIAINKFYEPIPYVSYWVMITYYIAQGLLARGILTIIPNSSK